MLIVERVIGCSSKQVEETMASNTKLKPINFSHISLLLVKKNFLSSDFIIFLIPHPLAVGSPLVSSPRGEG